MNQEAAEKEMTRLASSVCELKKARDLARRSQPSKEEKEALKKKEQELKIAENEMWDFARKHGFSVQISPQGKPVTYNDGCQESTYKAIVSSNSD